MFKNPNHLQFSKFFRSSNRIDGISEIHPKAKSLTKHQLSITRRKAGSLRNRLKNPDHSQRSHNVAALSRVISRRASFQVLPSRARTSSQLSLLSRHHRSGSRRALLRERENVRARARARARLSRTVAQVVAKCSRTYADVTTYRVGKHLASRAAYIHAAVTQLSRGTSLPLAARPPVRRLPSRVTSKSLRSFRCSLLSRSPLLLTINHHLSLSLSLSLSSPPPPRLVYVDR